MQTHSLLILSCAALLTNCGDQTTIRRDRIVEIRRSAHGADNVLVDDVVGWGFLCESSLEGVDYEDHWVLLPGYEPPKTGGPIRFVRAPDELDENCRSRSAFLEHAGQQLDKNKQAVYARAYVATHSAVPENLPNPPPFPKRPSNSSPPKGTGSVGAQLDCGRKRVDAMAYPMISTAGDAMAEIWVEHPDANASDAHEYWYYQDEFEAMPLDCGYLQIEHVTSNEDDMDPGIHAAMVARARGRGGSLAIASVRYYDHVPDDE